MKHKIPPCINISKYMDVLTAICRSLALLFVNALVVFQHLFLDGQSLQRVLWWYYLH